MRDNQENAAFLALPAEILGLIDQYAAEPDEEGDVDGTHPLLAVCKRCRDVILQQTSRLLVQVQNDGDHSDLDAMAGFIDKAARLGKPGLHLEVRLLNDSPDVGPPDDSCLPAILQPGIKQGGWHKLERMKLTFVSQCNTSNLHLVPAACPALRYLSLGPAIIGDGALFLALQRCPLETLQLCDCQLSKDAEESAVRAMAQLPSLKALLLSWSTPLSLASQVTSLTQLKLLCRHEPLEQLVQLAAQNPHLLSVQLSTPSSRGNVFPAVHLRSLLSALPSLTSLTLSCNTIDQGGLDALLELGTSITYLAVYSIRAVQDRSKQPCNWKHLHFAGGGEANSVYLGHLPLEGIETLAHWLEAETLGCFGLPVSTVAAEELPAVLSKAVLNLSSSVAWRQKPPSEIQLVTMAADQDEAPFWAGLPAHVWLPLFRALAPLGGPHVTSFKFTLLAASAVTLGAAELKALSSSLGQGLKHLYLEDYCNDSGHPAGVFIADDFWPALRTCFPGLQQLTLHNVGGSITEMDLIMCGQASTQPITFSVSPEMADDALDLELLQSKITTWGLSHVKIEQPEEH